MASQLSDKSSLNIIGAMVWGYGQLNTRISFLEHQAEMNELAIKEMKDLQDKPIPSDVKQDILLQKLEKEIDRLRDGKDR